MNNMNVNVTSEIGELKGVIIHTPGTEVENMTPQNVERALYSDILNLSVASEEYAEFSGVLSKLTSTYEVSNLLEEVLTDEKAKFTLVEAICKNESVTGLSERLLTCGTKELSRFLIEGVPIVYDSLTNYLSIERYSLQPLHNFFFTRDAAITIRDSVLIAKMSSNVRLRESIIMETIFNHHPKLKSKTINPLNSLKYLPDIKIEGGDLLVARQDILLSGIGTRTSTQGIDFLIDHFKERKEKQHIIVQELPDSPESFIHLDMVFTFLDKDSCMIYEPVVLNKHDYQTVHIIIDGGKVTIFEEDNIITALDKLGIHLQPLLCGGSKDSWVQEREQWHSGANFFAVAPGKVMGYARNSYTIEELNKNGFAVLPADEIISGKINPDDYNKFVVTVIGDELSRGGGGCRCMTMPVLREDVNW